jgi:hypothetical protein
MHSFALSQLEERHRVIAEDLSHSQTEKRYYLTGCKFFQ